MQWFLRNTGPHRAIYKKRMHINRFFFKENVRYPMWSCREPISLIIGTRFSLILGTRWWFSLIVGTRFSILGTRIRSLKRLKKPSCNYRYRHPHRNYIGQPKNIIPALLQVLATRIWNIMCWTYKMRSLLINFLSTIRDLTSVRALSCFGFHEVTTIQRSPSVATAL